MKKLVLVPALALSVLAVHASAHDHHEKHHADHKHETRHAGAHVHGEGQLTLAMDGSHLEINLSIAGHDIVGFETLKTDEQKAQLKEALALLESAAMWLPTAEAHCTLASAKAIVAGDHDHHDHHAASSGHTDISAQYTFRCRHPEQLAGLKTALFSTFKHSNLVKVQGFTDKGQFSAEMTRSQPEMHF